MPEDDFQFDFDKRGITGKRLVAAHTTANADDRTVILGLRYENQQAGQPREIVQLQVSMTAEVAQLLSQQLQGHVKRILNSWPSTESKPN